MSVVNGFEAFAALVLLASTASVPAWAEMKQQRGKQMIDQAVAALGGANFLSMRDRIETGKAYSSYDGEKFSGPMPTRIYTLYSDPPSPGSPAIRERQGLGKGEYRSLLFTDGAGYEITWRGARPLANDAIERHHSSTLMNIFYILRQRLGEPGLTFDFLGTTVRENQIVEAVDIRDAEGRTVTVYFHHVTKLPVRQVAYRRDPETREKVEEVTLFSRYQEVGSGVMWPFRVERERDGQRIFEMSLDSVQINQNLTEDLFALSAKTKLLD